MPPPCLNKNYYNENTKSIQLPLNNLFKLIFILIVCTSVFVILKATLPERYTVRIHQYQHPEFPLWHLHHRSLNIGNICFYSKRNVILFNVSNLIPNDWICFRLCWLSLNWSPEQISGALTQRGWHLHMNGFISKFIKINQKVLFTFKASKKIL